MPVKISAKTFFAGTGAGILGALLLAAIPTVIDWYGNPADIFHSDSGTNWGIVFETWFSWFWPIAILLVPVALLVHSWVSNRRAANAT